ncbi:MAG: hypothetical protein OEM52_02690 [bacterium]|nr:hypothetical protein [bacterium]
MIRHVGNTRGISVITVLFFIVILSVFGTTVVSQVVRQNLVAANSLKGQQAYYGALSACDRASRDIVTGVVTGNTNYAAYSIGNVSIELLTVRLTYVSPPYFLLSFDSEQVWRITAQTRVGDTYKQVVMYRARNAIAAKAGYWPAYRKNQVLFVTEERNFR